MSSPGACESLRLAPFGCSLPVVYWSEKSEVPDPPEVAKSVE
jgi:hypothetical protein